MLLSDHVLPVNIGNPAEMTVLQFAQEIVRLTGASSEIIFTEMPVDDPKVRQQDITRARAVLDWEPQVSLEQGLRRVIDYYSARR